MFDKILSRETDPFFLSFLKNGTIILLSSFLIGLLGQLAIPLPFTPIPIVTQLQAVFLLAILLGAKRAASSVFVFLVQGAMGFPVFANGAGGLAVLMGPRGGYLIGYLVAAYVVGALMERSKEKRVLLTFLAICLGNGIVYLLGAAYLSSFIGIKKGLLLGVAPFILGDLLKNIACLKILDWIDRRRTLVG